MNKKQFLISALILFFLSFILYARTLSYEYNGDDDIFIYENTITMAGFGRVSEIFTDDGTINGWIEFNKTNLEEQGFRKRYRPIPQFTFASEVALFGLNPGFSHFINVFLFSISVVLIYLLLLKLQLNSTKWYKSFPFWVAALFALHPIHTECVANIKSRDEILALFFFLIAILFAFKSFNSTLKFFTVFLFYLLALLSKENAITFLAIVPLFLVFVSKEKNGFIKHLRFISPFLLASVIFLLLSFTVVENSNIKNDAFTNYFSNLSFSELYGTIMISMGKYLQLLVFPVKLLCDYSVYEIPISSISSFLPIIILFLHLILFVLAIKLIKNKSIYAFAILFYFFTMSLYSNLVVSTGNAVAERFLYTPSLAFCIIVAYFLFVTLNSIIQKNNTIFPILIVITAGIFYGFKTIERVGDWKDYNTLITADVHKKTNCARLNYDYAELFFDGKKVKALDRDSLKIASEYYSKAVQIYPEYYDALNQLGLISYYQGEYISSSKYYYKSLLVKSDQLTVYKNLSIVLDSIETNAYVISMRKNLIKLNPQLPPLYYYLGKDYKVLGKNDSAIFYLKEALKKNPEFKKAEIELNQLR